MFAKSTNSQEAYGYGNSSGYDASLCADQRSETERSRRWRTVLRNKGCEVTQQDLPSPTADTSGQQELHLRCDRSEVIMKLQASAFRRCLTMTEAYRNMVFSIRISTRLFPASSSSGSSASGSTSTGGCDGLWQNVEIVAFALRFGYCHYGTNDGRYLNVNYTAGHAYWGIAAVLLLPPVGVAA